MREYNLFVIKNDYYYNYKNNPNLLYDILKNLFYLNSDFNYGVTLFEQLCNKVSVDTLRYYLNNKFSMNNKNKFYIDNIYLELKPTRIIVKSDYNYPKIMKALNCYNRYIFVCDFINEDYFWLSNFVRKEVFQYI